MREAFRVPLSAKTPKVVSPYGKRVVPASLKALSAATAQAVLQTDGETHDGADYAGTPGASVVAARGGKVIFAGFSKMYVSRKVKTEQHRLIIIRHSDGMSTRYVHLASLKVRPGTDVTSGQIIGTVSDSDEWTQPVLHFEIRDLRGQALDPVKTMAEFSQPDEVKVNP